MRWKLIRKPLTNYLVWVIEVSHVRKFTSSRHVHQTLAPIHRVDKCFTLQNFFVWKSELSSHLTVNVKLNNSFIICRYSVCLILCVTAHRFAKNNWSLLRQHVEISSVETLFLEKSYTDVLGFWIFYTPNELHNMV